MKPSNVNHILVGAFTLAMLVGMVVVAAMLSGRTGASDRYQAVFDNVGGIAHGTRVLFEGFPLGQVEEITPLPEGRRTRFAVHFSVRQGWRIPEDSTAFVAASGLLAPVTLNIQAGVGEAVLAPGGRLPSRPPADPFATIASLGQEVTALSREELKPLLSRLNRLTEGVEQTMARDGQSLLGNLQALSGLMVDAVPRWTDALERMTRRMEQLTNQIDGVVGGENRERINRGLANLDVLSGNLARLSGDLHGTREGVDRVLAALDKNLAGDDLAHAVTDLRHVLETTSRHIDTITQDLEGSARNMNEFTRRLREDPSLLLRGTAPGEKGP